MTDDLINNEAGIRIRFVKEWAVNPDPMPSMMTWCQCGAEFSHHGPDAAEREQEWIQTHPCPLRPIRMVSK